MQAFDTPEERQRASDIGIVPGRKSPIISGESFPSQDEFNDEAAALLNNSTTKLVGVMWGSKLNATRLVRLMRKHKTTNAGTAPAGSYGIRVRTISSRIPASTSSQFSFVRLMN